MHRRNLDGIIRNFAVFSRFAGGFIRSKGDGWTNLSGIVDIFRWIRFILACRYKKLAVRFRTRNFKIVHRRSEIRAFRLR